MINNELKYIKMMQKEPGFPIIFNSFNLYVFDNKHIIIESLLDNLNKEFDLNSIFLIDFGLMAPYVGFKTKKIYGTLLYSSINNYKGKRQSRKDDLESIMYI